MKKCSGFEDINIDDNDVRIIQNLYYNQRASVRERNSEVQTTNIKKGVRQGSALSPDLFNLFSENMLTCIGDLEDWGKEH